MKYDPEAAATELLRTLFARLGAEFFDARPEPVCQVIESGRLVVTVGEYRFFADEATGEPMAARTGGPDGKFQAGWVSRDGEFVWGRVPFAPASAN